MKCPNVGLFGASTGVLALAVAISACGDITTVGGETTLRVLLTDAPADYIDSASVDIGAVELIPAGEGEPITISEDGTDGFINLLDLADAATMLLGEAEVEAGAYAQLRLVVEAARVALVEGYVFNDDDATERDLIVPSGAQTGIKLKLRGPDGAGPVEIDAGEAVLVLDFDVGRSFVILGNPETPAGIHGVLFKPTIRVAVAGDLGTISGTVSTALTSQSVEGLSVTAEPVDPDPMEPFQTQAVMGTTGEDGTYTLSFVVPGTYVVSVTTPEGLATEPATVEVEVGPNEDVEGVDFSLVGGG